MRSGAALGGAWRCPVTRLGTATEPSASPALRESRSIDCHTVRPRGSRLARERAGGQRLATRVGPLVGRGGAGLRGKATSVTAAVAISHLAPGLRSSSGALAPRVDMFIQMANGCTYAYGGVRWSDGALCPAPRPPRAGPRPRTRGQFELRNILGRGGLLRTAALFISASAYKASSAVPGGGRRWPAVPGSASYTHPNKRDMLLPGRA